MCVLRKSTKRQLKSGVAQEAPLPLHYTVLFIKKEYCLLARKDEKWSSLHLLFKKQLHISNLLQRLLGQLQGILNTTFFQPTLLRNRARGNRELLKRTGHMKKI